jgi:hypothetical protein
VQIWNVLECVLLRRKMFESRLRHGVNCFVSDFGAQPGPAIGHGPTVDQPCALLLLKRLKTSENDNSVLF